MRTARTRLLRGSFGGDVPVVRAFGTGQSGTKTGRFNGIDATALGFFTARVLEAGVAIVRESHPPSVYVCGLGARHRKRPDVDHEH